MKVLTVLNHVDKGYVSGPVFRFEYFVEQDRDESKSLKKKTGKLGIRADTLYSFHPFDDLYSEFVSVEDALEMGGSFEHKSLAKVEAHQAMVIDSLTSLAARLDVPLEVEVRNLLEA